MLIGKGAFAFRKHFLELIIEELKHDENILKGKNEGVSECMILTQIIHSNSRRIMILKMAIG